MDFGALCCTPKLPKCESCPFVSICIAYNTNNINKLPVKLKKIKITKRFLNYLIINHEEQFVLSKINQGIWKGMYQFPFVELDNKTNKNKLLESENWKKFFCNYKYKVTGSSEVYLHKLSHQKIYATFWFVDVHNFNKNNFKCVSKHEFIKLPIPRLIDKFINDYKLI